MTEVPKPKTPKFQNQQTKAANLNLWPKNKNLENRHLIKLQRRPTIPRNTKLTSHMNPKNKHSKT